MALHHFYVNNSLYFVLCSMLRYSNGRLHHICVNHKDSLDDNLCFTLWLISFQLRSRFAEEFILHRRGAMQCGVFM